LLETALATKQPLEAPARASQGSPPAVLLFS